MARSVTSPRVSHQKTCISAISAVPSRQKFAFISAWLRSTFQKTRVQTYIIPLNFTFLKTSHLKIYSAAITIAPPSLMFVSWSLAPFQVSCQKTCISAILAVPSRHRFIVKMFELKAKNSQDHSELIWRAT